MDATDYAVVQIAFLNSLRKLVLTGTCLSTSTRKRTLPLYFQQGEAMLEILLCASNLIYSISWTTKG